MNKLFDELMESVQQMDEIVRGERQAYRDFTVDALQVRAIRKETGLSQAKFAHMIDIQLNTLRNWEQGRRNPTAPPKPCSRPSTTTPNMSSRPWRVERGDAGEWVGR